MSGYNSFIGTAYELFVATFLHFNYDVNNKIDFRTWFFKSQIKINPELSFFNKELSLDLYSTNGEDECYFECKYSKNPIALSFSSDIFLDGLVEFIGLSTYREKLIGQKVVYFAFATTHDISKLLREKEIILTGSSDYVNNKVKIINKFIKSGKKWKNVDKKIGSNLLKNTLLKTKIMNLDSHSLINNINSNDKETYFTNLVLKSSNIKKYDSFFENINFNYNIEYYDKGEYYVANIMGNKIKVMDRIIFLLKKYLNESHHANYIIIKLYEELKDVKFKYYNIGEHDALKYFNESLSDKIMEEFTEYFCILIPMNRELFIFKTQYIIELSERILGVDNRYHLKKIPHSPEVTRQLYKLAITEAKRIIGKIITNDLFIE